MRRMRLGRWLALGLLLGAWPAGAAAGSSLTVFAASDLAFAFQELVPRFEQAHGVRVTVVLGSTGNLARQIEQGAPADVFFAADESFVESLVTRQVLVGQTATRYAEGRLVLAVSTRLGMPLATLGDLRDGRVRHVAIANPRHAPYGRAAKDALERAGVWAALQPKLVYGDNVRQALQYVQSGAADAGLVALSVAQVPEVRWTLIDGRLHAPLNQAAAVVRRAASPEVGLAFIRFVTGAAGREILRRHGFGLPGEF